MAYVYNPLDKKNLADSIAKALLATDVKPLADIGDLHGAGVYAIYYTGAFKPYAQIVKRNKSGAFAHPIYVGKAQPPGARAGITELDAAKGNALKNRLEEHAESIQQATSTLRIQDFRFRSLVVDDIWIPLGESILIQTYHPLWNHPVDGFGNHNPGSGRHQGKVSSWDTLHPGRTWTANLTGGSKHTVEQITERIKSAAIVNARP